MRYPVIVSNDPDIQLFERIIAKATSMGWIPHTTPNTPRCTCEIQLPKQRGILISHLLLLRHLRPRAYDRHRSWVERVVLRDMRIVPNTSPLLRGVKVAPGPGVL